MPFKPGEDSKICVVSFLVIDKSRTIGFLETKEREQVQSCLPFLPQSCLLVVDTD